jgi:hypothetical protein
MAHVRKHGMDGLDELPQEAVQVLAKQQPSDRAPQPPGGDAG